VAKKRKAEKIVSIGGKMKKVISILAVFISQSAMSEGVTPDSPYSPTRLEWMLLNINFRLSQFVDKHKPECFEVTKTINCIGFSNNKVRNKVMREKIKEDFDKLSEHLGIKGQLKLYLPPEN